MGFDFALSRLVGLLPENQVGAVRKVRFKGGINLCYRLNKGDLHGIREVWFDEAYRLPFEDPSGTLLDLGANIGLTSVWLAKRYPFSRVIAVEPDPSNAALVRRNLELNGIHGEVLQTAIGDHEGTAMFALNRNSNLGRLSDHGVAVPMTTVAAILENAACSRLGLVKIDIEGGEQQLFDGPIDWLASTDAIIAELHPALADCSRIVETISKRGFEYIRSNSVFPDNMDCFKSTDSS
ncbi:MAG: FkbM family methyltransferase [Candidatus Acidiferrales bacterium]